MGICTLPACTAAGIQEATPLKILLQVWHCLVSNTHTNWMLYSGALGAGLAIFTRYPILSVGIQPYALNGTPLDVAGGDWFVGKAAAHVVIRHPILGQVQVFNTHVRQNLTIA